MERNADDLSGGSSAGGMGAAGSTGGYGSSGSAGGASGTGAGGASASGAGGSGFGAPSSAGTGTAGIGGRARDLAGTAKDKLADVGSTVREQTGVAKDKLADALESGAEKLRQRSSGGQLSAATETSGSTALETTSDGKMTQVTDKVAGGMQATADWLRDADLDSVRLGVERQVKEHPGRTLLIAVGLGYLLGKAFRK
jgi:hypothetical protein